MSKKCLIPLAVLLFLAAQAQAGLDAYEYSVSVIGDDVTGVVGGITGPVEVEYDGRIVDQYTVTGWGRDIWDNWDQFHYAYRDLEGAWRVSAHVEIIDNANHNWSKAGVMVRDSTDPRSVHYSVVRRGQDGRTHGQWRSSYGSGSSGNDKDLNAVRLGVQALPVGPLVLVEQLVDYGSGWESVGVNATTALDNTNLYGMAVTSHTVQDMAVATFTDVVYEQITLDDFVGDVPVATVAADTMTPGGCEGRPSGFQVRSIKATFTDGWGYAEMNKLLDWGCTGPFCTGPGMPIPGMEEGVRIVDLVNLRDSDPGDAFGNDQSFPGIDPFEQPTGEPAAGDNDDSFATEVLACIYLTEGLHVIGANSDDGTIIKIGGVEVARTVEWKGQYNVDFLIDVEATGWYSLEARSLEGGGGAGLELHEVLMDGTRILMGDVANGGSPVVVPEPATIALLGLGGLALVRIRRKS